MCNIEYITIGHFMKYNVVVYFLCQVIFIFLWFKRLWHTLPYSKTKE